MSMLRLPIYRKALKIHPKETSTGSPSIKHKTLELFDTTPLTSAEFVNSIRLGGPTHGVTHPQLLVPFQPCKD